MYSDSHLICSFICSLIGKQNQTKYGTLIPWMRVSTISMANFAVYEEEVYWFVYIVHVCGKTRSLNRKYSSFIMSSVLVPNGSDPFVPLFQRWPCRHCVWQIIISQAVNGPIVWSHGLSQESFHLPANDVTCFVILNALQPAAIFLLSNDDLS